MTCADCGTDIGNTPVNLKVFCADCGFARIDKIIAESEETEAILAEEYDEAFGYHEADCGC